VYTSGSTGQPKGVVQTHRTLYNLVQWQASHCGIEPGSRLLQYASFGFDVSVQDVCFTLATGGTLYVLDDAGRTSFGEMARIIGDEHIQVLSMPYSVLAALFEELEGEYPSIRHLITAGEQVVLNNRLGEYVEKHAGVTLHNQYGPSETHVVTSFELAGGTPRVPLYPPIGKPIHNHRVYILDQDLALVPAGVPGEIYIQGHGLFREYLNQPELTEKRRVDNPHCPGEPFYKTGDLGRWLPDGNIEFLGRNDHQVKIRGNRVELKEIEIVLTRYPGVRNAVVHCHDGQLAGYLVAGDAVVKAELLAYLQDLLPAYMIPTHFFFLEALPLNLNGKVDYKALPVPDPGEARPAYCPPVTEPEKVLCAIWAEVFETELVSTQANFFRIGGNSLVATRVMSRIRKKYDIDLPLKYLYLHPTIQELAGYIDVLRWGKESQGLLVPEEDSENIVI
jgi:fengycin family lipopeptide synthetase D/gramicidin S synthase 2/tyrocidine synthetase-2